MSQKMVFSILIAILAVSGMFGQSDFKTVEESGVLFQWKIDGGDIHIRLTAPTEGWVAVGFNPSRAMKDADFKLAYVDGSEVVIEDHFGSGLFKHKKDMDLGGTDDFQLVSGSESDGSTTVEFIMPLNSGDDKDSLLEEGVEAKVLLAYARNDDIRRKHSWKTSLMVEL